MADFVVRQALLDDTAAISLLARSRISAWQRIGADNTVENVAYNDLSLYERWLHGGAWMNIETGAMQLSRLLLGGAVPITVTLNDRVVGYAECYPGTEPQPYGRHLHLGFLVASLDVSGADDALLGWLLGYAREHGYQRLTANGAANDDRAKAFYERNNMQVIEEVRRMLLKAKAGQVFYKAVEHPDANPDQISGWHLCIGRAGSARYEWDAHWHTTWDVIPQIRKQRTHRLYLQAAGNEAFVLAQQQLYRPRLVDVYCWTPKPPTGQMITAIRDWAQGEGYRTLVLPTVEGAVKTLGLEAEPDGYREYVYAVEI